MTKGKVGMYGGKFLPVHQGHVYAMIRASTMVDELHVVVSYDEEYEKEILFKNAKIKHIPYNVRLRWWSQITKDMPHVHVHAVEEKQTGHIDDWERGSVLIKGAVGKQIDIVFSSEYEYGEIFEKLYSDAEHVVIDAKRETYDISATRIREDGALKHWDMIPNIVKPYFTKKIVVVGTESAGKSTMVKNLANLYNTSYVEEFGRTYYERLGDCADITLETDYPEIAFEHKYHEKTMLEKANKIQFVDTEAIVTQYYSMLYLNKRDAIVDEIARSQEYHLWLFLEPDVVWVDDGMRVHGDKDVRNKNNNILKQLLNEFDVEYAEISGNYQERLRNAISLVDELLDT